MLSCRSELRVFACVSFLVAWPAGGAPLAHASGTALTLTLAEAQARASRQAPEVRLSELGVREAEATRVGAGIRLPENPRITLDGRPGLDSSSRGELGFGAGVEVRFEAANAAGARLREADGRTKVARADVQVVRLEARLRAFRAYVEARIAALRIDQAREAIALGERVLQAAKERASAGAGSDIDVTSANAELAERRAELHAAEAERVVAEMELRYLTGLPPETALQLSSPVEAVAPLPAPSELLSRALARRPDLAVLRARLELNEAAGERLRKEALPRLGAYALVDSSPVSPTFGIAGISIELPVAQRNQGPRAVLAAERQTELLRLEVETRRVALELQATTGAYKARLAELEVLTREAIPAAERRLSLVETGWRSGRFDIFRLTTAAQDLVRLRAARADALERIWQERIVLERLVGGFSDDRS